MIGTGSVGAPLTIPMMLSATVDRHPDREALVDGELRLSYGAWNERIERVAAGLTQIGLRRYDRVALLTGVGEPMATLYFACQKLGAIAVPMNHRLSAGEAGHILADSGARALAYSARLAPQAVGACDRAGGGRQLVVVGAGTEGAPAGHHDYEQLARAHPGPDVSGAVAPEDVSALMYTSGTTGRAKGVVHSHANDVAAAMNCGLEYQLGADDRALHICPLHHVGGMQAFFIPHLLVGAANLLHSRYEAARALAAIEAEAITTLFAVPAQIEQLLALVSAGAADASSLRMITTGGAALPAETMERVLDRLCPRLYNGYGMTEASLTLLLHPREMRAKLGSCGKPTLISQARIVTHETDRDVAPDEQVAPGEVGQLIARGPQMTPGYWSGTAEQSVRLRHGWIYTGDLFTQDAEGYYWFRGRADDLIVSGGENIYPSEVEEVVRRCPGIAEVKVVGLPDDRWGTIVAAFVVRGDPLLDETAIDGFCRDSDELAAFKRPRRIVFVDSLPISASGKVLGRELVARYA